MAFSVYVTPRCQIAAIESNSEIANLTVDAKPARTDTNRATDAVIETTTNPYHCGPIPISAKHSGKPTDRNRHAPQA